MENNPSLGIPQFRYSDLHDYAGLTKLAEVFDGFVRTNEEALFGRFDAYRSAIQSGIAHGGLSLPDESALLIEVSRALGVFLSQLFQIDAPVAALKARAARDTQV